MRRHPRSRFITKTHVTRILLPPLPAASITDGRGRVASAMPKMGTHASVICVSVAHVLGAWPSLARNFALSSRTVPT